MKFYSEADIDCMLDGCDSIEMFKNKLADDKACFDVDVLDVVEGEVIVVSFPADRGEDATKLTKLIQSTYPENPTIGVVDDIDIMIQYPEDALKMLDGMRAKIEILKDTKPSIVLT